MEKTTYSLIIPLYNESESLTQLWKEIKSTMSLLSKNWEVIFVNDGSTDDSKDVIEKLAKRNRNIRTITFRHNQGKSAGLMAGFNAAMGEIIISLDADLQDDPREIPKLIAKMSKGYDLVSGYKKKRHDPFHKTIPSRLFNYIVGLFTGTKLHDINCGFKVYRKSVAGSLNLYGDHYRFIPILASIDGFKVSEVVVNHRARKFGKSKFGVTRFSRGFFDLMAIIFLTKFLKRPLHFFGTIGSLSSFIGIIICSYLTYIHFVNRATIGRRPLLLLGVLLIISGIQLICTGLVAELITFYHQRMTLEATIKSKLTKVAPVKHASIQKKR